MRHKPGGNTESRIAGWRDFKTLMAASQNMGKGCKRQQHNKLIICNISNSASPHHPLFNRTHLSDVWHKVVSVSVY